MRLFFAFWIAVSLSAAPRVIAVTIDGMVHPVTVEIVGDALAQAQREHAQLVLVRLNTPGGLLDATREIIEKLDASSVPVVTYVTPSGGRAASAGFFLLEAGDIAAMAPGTNTGAASPVLMGQQMDPVMRSKIENDTAAMLRTLTGRRGRNVELAEKTIREAKAFTDQEALANKLVEWVVLDERRLLAELNGREITRFDGSKHKLDLGGAEIVEARTTLRERLIAAIADPNIGFVLLALGALGIYVEFSSPGLIFPGVAGGVLLLLGLSSLAVLPINWAGAGLIALGLAFFVLEAKYASHGVLGIGGAVSMVLGALFLVNGPPEMRIHLGTALSVTLPFAAITIFLVSLVIKARANKVITGVSGMLGSIGVTRTALNPAGTVLVRGEYWNATSNAPMDAGVRVRIAAVDGMTLRVEADV